MFQPSSIYCYSQGTRRGKRGSFQDNAQSRICCRWGQSSSKPSPVNELKHEDIVQVASGGKHFVVLTRDGRVYTWGKGNSGQLGHGDRADLSSPKLVESLANVRTIIVQCAAAQTAIITEDGKLYWCGWMGEQPFYTPTLREDLCNVGKVVQVATGAYHIAVIVEKGMERLVYSWGQGNKGQLGHGNLAPCSTPKVIEALKNIKVVDICAGEECTGIITFEGEVMSWGSNAESGLGFPIPPSGVTDVQLPTKLTTLAGIPIVDLSFGFMYGAALSDAGEVYTWGRNTEGQLGIGTTNPSANPTLVKALTGNYSVGVSCGYNHMFAWTEMGEVFSWGSNKDAKLGHGDLKDEFLTLPRKMDKIDAGNIVSDLSAGATTLAAISAANLSVAFGSKTHVQLVSNDMTVESLKTQFCTLWGLNPKQIVVQDSMGTLLPPNDSIRRKICHGLTHVVLINKESITEMDDAEMKFSLKDGDFPVVKGGTVERLVDWLTNARYPVHDFQEVFLLTYRTFMTPSSLLDMLINRYTSFHEDKTSYARLDKEQTHSIIKHRVLHVLGNWIRNHPMDFFGASEDSRNLLQNLHKFINETLFGEDEINAIKLGRLYNKMDLSRHDSSANSFLSPPPEPLLPEGDATNFFWAYPSLEIARQLSLLGWTMFAKIEPKECFYQAWNKEDKETAAPQITQMIKWSNNITQWVAAVILLEKVRKNRQKAYEKFVSVAEHCIGLNNFNSAMEIVSGLNSTPVNLVRSSWDMAQNIEEKVSSLSAFFLESNSQSYRTKLRAIGPPCVPFLGVHLRDLTFIEDGNPDQLPGGLINFYKCTKLAETIREIQKFQKTSYNLQALPNLQQFLLRVKGFNDHAQEAYELAKKLQSYPDLELGDANERTSLLLSDDSLSNILKRKLCDASAESQIIFLDKQALIMTNRHRQEDMAGERERLWIQWVAKLNESGLLFINDLGQRQAFKQVFLKSSAIERSIQSLFIYWPAEQSIITLEKLLHATLVHSLDVKKLLSMLHQVSLLHLPEAHRITMGEIVSCFKDFATSEAQSKPRTISQAVALGLPKDAENVPDEEAILKGKRRKYKRAAQLVLTLSNQVQQCSTEANQLEAGPLKEEKIIQLSEFIEEQRQRLEIDVQGLQSLAKASDLAAEANSALNAYQEAEDAVIRLQVENENIQADIDVIQQRIQKLMAEAEDTLKKKESYFTDLSLLIERSEAKRVDRENVAKFFSVFMATQFHNHSTQVHSHHKQCHLQLMNNINTFITQALSTLGYTRLKMIDIRKDLANMAKYGPSVMSSLEAEFEYQKQCCNEISNTVVDVFEIFQEALTKVEPEIDLLQLILEVEEKFKGLCELQQLIRQDHSDL